MIFSKKFEGLKIGESFGLRNGVMVYMKVSDTRYIQLSDPYPPEAPIYYSHKVESPNKLQVKPSGVLDQEVIWND